MTKRIICLVLMLAMPTWGARAILLNVDRLEGHTDPPNPQVIMWLITAGYQGPDVPNGARSSQFFVSVSSFATPVQIQSAIVTGIQNQAANNLGFTVPAGQTLMPTMSLQ